jgi:NAD(P)-dependent dehydrogenase (short-subunit alcohol dehydrogenase family)
MKHDGLRVLITGGSRGLGRALAAKLLALGARVALVARDRSELEAARASLAPSGEVHVIAEDVGTPGSALRIAHEAARLLGGIDVLFNNASTLGPTPLRLLLDTSVADFERVLAVNLIGPFHLAQIVGGSMVQRRSGTIVNISSDAAVSPYPGWGAYGASKAALDHLSAILAAELEGSGVRVLAIDPGEMDTAMHRAAIPGADASLLASPDAVASRIVEMIPTAASGRAIAGRPS